MLFFLLFAFATPSAWAAAPPAHSFLSQDPIPSRAKRIQAFERAGLLAETAGMDELDQDLLYMRAQRAAAPELSAAYPKLPTAKLRSLQGFVKGEK